MEDILAKEHPLRPLQIWLVRDISWMLDRIGIWNLETRLTSWALCHVLGPFLSSFFCNIHMLGGNCHWGVNNVLVQISPLIFTGSNWLVTYLAFQMNTVIMYILCTLYSYNNNRWHKWFGTINDTDQKQSTIFCLGKKKKDSWPKYFWKVLAKALHFAKIKARKTSHCVQIPWCFIFKSTSASDWNRRWHRVSTDFLPVDKLASLLLQCSH